LEQDANSLTGKVYLVGAGPGDPALITVRGLHWLETADVVVYDRLIDRRLLEKVPQNAEVIFVGKGRGTKVIDQEGINNLLVKKSKEGKTVVRLKGGDPFIFGRGGEEVQTLAENNVPFEIVPGVTSATAAAAYAGIPLTSRNIASSFTVVSGTEAPNKGKLSTQWDALANSGDTLVVLMGWESLANIVESLQRSGMHSSTPIALVRWGTEPYQRTVVGTLTNIVERGKDASLSPPVVAIIGEVVNLRDELSWFEKKPLFGKKVLVTRSRKQASILSNMLAIEGAEPIEVPTIEIAPLEDTALIDKAIGHLAKYQWVIFTSVNGVHALFKRLFDLGMDTRSFSNNKIAAVGSATAQALFQHGVQADFIPDQYISGAIVLGLKELNLNKAAVLLPSTDIVTNVLYNGLCDLGALVDRVTVYRTIIPLKSDAEALTLLQDGRIDVVTFTSSSTVRNLVSMLDSNPDLLNRTVVGCIGPVTAATAHGLKINVDFIAHQHTIYGLVEALKKYFAPQGDE